MQNELKVRVSCPICGQPILAKSIEGHLKKIHELTGVVTLRLHPASPYRHEPEAKELELEPAEEKQGGGEAATELATEPEAEAEAAAKAEAEAAS